ncbi:hypothetical protein HYT32_01895 [Candidatus Roizmanbacteria bacterium]|nr:hypothetical protein [Candidatus Roizmanbacteria bacterium]
MRYKVVGLSNLIFGALLSIYAFSMLFVVVPRLSSLYTELNIDVGSSVTGTNIRMVFILIFGLLGILLGAKLLSKPSKIYFKIGVIFLALYLVWWGLGIINSMLINVNPPDLIR